MTPEPEAIVLTRLGLFRLTFLGDIDREPQLSVKGENAVSVRIHDLIKTDGNKNLVFRHLLLLGPSWAQRARGPSSPGRTGSAPVAPAATGKTSG